MQVRHKENIGAIRIKAPSICSLIESPELTIKFFRQAETAYKNRKPVIYDLSDCTTFTETSTALLAAYLKDRNINFGRPSNVIFPINVKCKKALHDRGILKKYDTDGKEFTFCDAPVQKVSNILVENHVAKGIVKSASFFIYQEERRIKELYSLLIEIMANTNNHADSKKSGVYPWWLSIYRDIENNSVKFVFIDLGLGIFESLPVQQYMNKNPNTYMSYSGQIKQELRRQNIAALFTALINGQIKSSTGDPTRGRGLPLIAKNAKSGHFKAFKMIANDAYIDLISNETAVMNEHFSGTLYYFELAEYSI